MPTINNPIVFSPEAVDRISTVSSREHYSHREWSCDDLEVVRCEIRDHYRGEQRANCVYCRKPLSIRSALGAHVEHVASKSVYPNYMFEPLNLCVACPDCNETKAEREVFADPVIVGRPPVRYPTRSDRFRLVHPHFDEYDEHIKHAGDFYLSQTPKGAYTIYVCGLDRFLIAFGVTQEILDDLQAISDRHRFHGG
jgi:hypothetical protein